jgi:nicotinamidase-related amidase
MEQESGVQDILWAGNSTFAIRHELAPLPEETVLNKTTWSAFNSSAIESVLQSAGIRNLVLTGVATNGCVEITARDAADRGYGCVIVDQATADYDQAAQDAALSACYYTYGRIARSPADVIGALESEAII